MQWKGAWTRITSLLMLMFLLSSLIPHLQLRATNEREFQPLAQPLSTDVPSWFLGESWTYHSDIYSGISTDYYEAHGEATSSVREIMLVTQNAKNYYVYNITLDGTLKSNGTITIDGTPINYNVTNGAVSGYAWIERGDLAILRDNQTISGRGYAETVFGDLPFSFDGASTGYYNITEEDLDFLIEVGEKWHVKLLRRMIGYRHIYVDMPSPLPDIEDTSYFEDIDYIDDDVWCNETVNVELKMGTFETFYVHGLGTQNSSDPGRINDKWYSPLVKNLVKSEYHEVEADHYAHAYINLTSYHTTSSPIQLEVNLDPSIANPGGNVTLRGWSPAQNAQVKIVIPVLEIQYETATDASGNFSFNFTSPFMDDNTPSNKDIGSHGVIVEVRDGMLLGYNVKTLTLIRPDLWIASEDISFSAYPPFEGVEVSIMVTVHTSENVGVYNPFLVSFFDDGQLIGEDTIPSLHANSTVISSIGWIPQSGLHTIVVYVDSLDQITETNEENNTAQIAIFISRPDLTPSEISIKNSFSLFYQDASARNFLSEPIEVNLGEIISISSNVSNVGNSSSGAKFRVVFYNTSGERGPLEGLPFYDSGPVGPLEAGQKSGPYQSYWRAPNTAGDKYINITVDFDNYIPELEEENNTFVLHLNVDGPDYILSDITRSPIEVTVGGQKTIYASVKNMGGRDSNKNTTIAFYNESSPLSPFFTETIPPLSIDQTSSRYESIWLAPSVPGTYNVTVIADYYEDMLESNESNNIAKIQFLVLEKPQTTLVFNGPHYSTQPTFITSGTQMSFQVTDNSGWGIRSTHYRLDEGPWLNYPFLSSFNISEEGPHTLFFNSTDNLGGAESTKSYDLWVDNTPPITNIFPKIENATFDTLFSFSTEDVGSGVESTWYKIDQGSWIRYSQPFSIQEQSFHNITYKSIDNLGNEESPKVHQVHVLEGYIQVAPTPNYKPLIAIAFAVILLILGLMLGWKISRQTAGKEAKREGGKLRKWMWIFAFIALPFALAEIVTGAVSLFVPALSIPPWFGGALILDLAILVSGLATFFLVRRWKASV